MRRPKVMLIFGMRPESIKMAPEVARLRRCSAELDTCVVVTAQRRQMLDQVLDAFIIKPDYDLDIMQPVQSLSGITARTLTGLEGVLGSEVPNLVMVQDDTTTAFVEGLVAPGQSHLKFDALYMGYIVIFAGCRLSVDFHIWAKSWN